tara:strand:+ start:13627 stop:14814 length:1188 start_codon:yes stop_codon:yes gene_type:complete
MFDKYNSFMEFYGDVCENPKDPVERKLAVIQKRNIAFGGKGSAPDPNPGMLASAEAAKVNADTQREIAKEQLDFYKKQYEEFKPTLTKVLEGQTLAQDESNRMAAEYEKYMKETFRPLEQTLVDQAANYNTDAERERLSRDAMGDVSGAFSGMRQQQNRQQRAAGIAPGSGRFAALNQQLNLQEALARASAGTQTRDAAVEKGRAMTYDAAALGRNLPSNVTGSYGTGLQAAAGANQTMQNSGQIMQPGYAGANNAYQGANAGYGTAGNIYGQEFSGRMQGYQAQQQADAALWSGIGGAAGMAFGGTKGFGMFKADGGDVSTPFNRSGIHSGPGPVRGPGGPVDDKIPAMLSNGEYVIPADTVNKIGRKHLDELVKGTHTPAAVQRARKALKGKK